MNSPPWPRGGVDPAAGALLARCCVRRRPPAAPSPLASSCRFLVRPRSAASFGLRLCAQPMALHGFISRAPDRAAGLPAHSPAPWRPWFLMPASVRGPFEPGHRTGLGVRSHRTDNQPMVCEAPRLAPHRDVSLSAERMPMPWVPGNVAGQALFLRALPGARHVAFGMRYMRDVTTWNRWGSCDVSCN